MSEACGAKAPEDIKIPRSTKELSGASRLSPHPLRLCGGSFAFPPHTFLRALCGGSFAFPPHAFLRALCASAVDLSLFRLTPFSAPSAPPRWIFRFSASHLSPRPLRLRGGSFAFPPHTFLRALCASAVDLSPFRLTPFSAPSAPLRWIFRFSASRFTPHCSLQFLFTVHCSLFTVHCSLFSLASQCVANYPVTRLF